MKYIQSILLLLVFSVYIHANISIDEQIHMIKAESSPQKRVEMMNQIKVQLFQMNQMQREKTLHKLRGTTNASSLILQGAKQQQIQQGQRSQQQRSGQNNLNLKNIPSKSKTQKIQKSHH